MLLCFQTEKVDLFECHPEAQEIKRGEKKYIATVMLKDSLGTLCIPHSHSLLHLHAELSEAPEKESERGNRTEK